MNKAFIEEMATRLQSERESLTKELSSFTVKDSKAKVADYTTKFEEYGDDEDENASEVADYSNKLSLESALEKEVRDIDSAIIRIKEGSYGICKYCNTEINEDRLRARPTSTSCIACKKTLTQEV
ncbi:hypothetical protein CO057_04520 [Candidatus Uhrbacteria bacterium CG_4_9_14_0_2_um_filter_41_50]|uniref:Zinc finger DksA/TraR C4-type domain-containing protein n=1 Tax=Candidatus Uhrbacteria bacterium CG_4_9_14_0_2_um_filter_41_50 TaxID=1975031 RepID=A0A2M8EN91_9BACT|nr:MAG: hypothetical protein COZ45_01770 [Candidatus Uhrbacteria bacterium CG_4_10_14_3_um_filter_41_21]PIZ55179.1 MAG: hypothetical protein COY24_01465 [Candidatus Uhrbacteria bacterium CG_4_10_14_0_2_um_filter_41_21]PJB84887.1 MAG: hypothetical protein CO086_01325 [Candidatus Uhrbacteria bacterium CG_4_9_14_0_8_um_filter_41_16]PJC24147.1 MAG: hypothetical protein CO057_04520 [Candidatus Uhrbacteria bacterium CG_4_9_14_0_2_um_filter_41_50]PJE75036.1 MAG: hypothetical protein COV03_02390 [Candi